MMPVNLSFVIGVSVVLCVVQCSVVVNVYGEDAADSNNLPHGVKGICDTKSCDAFCLNSSYDEGICLPSGECLCYDQSRAFLVNMEPAGDSSQTKEIGAARCSPSACNHMCQSLGFQGGICISNTKCLCKDKSVASTQPSKNLATVAAQTREIISRELVSCSQAACNELCLGLTGGVCLSATECACFDNVSPSYSEVKEASGCSLPPCLEHCRRLGYKSGTCLPDCLCSREKGTDQSTNDAYYFYQLSSKIEKPKRKDEQKIHTCAFECEPFCRIFGIPGGACVNGACDCSGSTTGKKRSLKLSCDEFICSPLCISNGYYGGFCLFDACFCY